MLETKLRTQDERDKLRSFLIKFAADCLRDGDVRETKAVGRSILILDWIEGKDNPIGNFIELYAAIDGPEEEYQQLKEKTIRAIEVARG